ncbi:N-terminal domain of NEFA-interacting nuclear protein NIP30-domain-containing protein [Pterulicium gracile]|uniref:N-terminal domain of NEFA-interacting nuclear protein NIP30-domain-containing protein n=1 Tax=Pterulicium gracile TaxID=1884261 RepID=A0A5C3R614_9AGAR|nr:N-terminal domain of NEFA-interacting nuclear protein NIP30-domain-containing protein [Pterula gracilis]
MADGSEALIPSLSSGVVGSRFVTESEVDLVRARRDEQWKAAYARLGQEPPPQPKDEVFDGRSLAEKLAANKIAKQEEWEEKTKLANQFRALEEDEVMFLDSLREKEAEEERQRKEKDGEEVQEFRQAVAARTSAANKPTAGDPQDIVEQPEEKPVVAITKKPKAKLLKGVVVKKKAKPPMKPPVASEQPASKVEDELPQAKRRKV